MPSDVEITRSVNDGRPIVLSRPKSEAAQSFRRLAEAFIARAAGGAVEADAGAAAEKRRRSRPRLHLLARRH